MTSCNRKTLPVKEFCCDSPYPLSSRTYGGKINELLLTQEGQYYVLHSLIEKLKAINDTGLLAYVKMEVILSELTTNSYQKAVVEKIGYIDKWGVQNYEQNT